MDKLKLIKEQLKTIEREDSRRYDDGVSFMNELRKSFKTKNELKAFQEAIRLTAKTINSFLDQNRDEDNISNKMLLSLASLDMILFILLEKEILEIEERVNNAMNK